MMTIILCKFWTHACRICRTPTTRDAQPGGSQAARSLSVGATDVARLIDPQNLAAEQSMK
eukprot:scaffold82697_cov18-Prasinocladus_malaysianus.AAC.1